MNRKETTMNSTEELLAEMASIKRANPNCTNPLFDKLLVIERELHKRESYQGQYIATGNVWD
jgi:hypothetical protein